MGNGHFDRAVAVILQHEGGLADNLKDPGGITNFGISIRFVRDILPQQMASGVTLGFPLRPLPGDIRQLTREQAIEIYQKCWWDFFGYNTINDAQVATKLMDAAVNMGPPSVRSTIVGPAHELAQLAASDCGYHVIASGLIGPIDITAINECEPTSWLRAMGARMADRYRALVAADPKLEIFLGNWLHRSRWPF